MGETEWVVAKEKTIRGTTGGTQKAARDGTVNREVEIFMEQGQEEVLSSCRCQFEDII